MNGKKMMSRINSLFLLSAALFLVHVPLASADSHPVITYSVGSCIAGGYSTISAALAASPAPDVVEVCPGTYPEQIEITNPVTLEGISTSTSDQVFIAVPSSGLSTSDACYLVNATQNQVCVAYAGTVNLTNITVDGGSTNPYGGIFYLETSGTLNHVEVRFQVEAIQTSDDFFKTFTVANSNIHSFKAEGIDTDAGTLNITGNTFAAEPGAIAGIFSWGGQSATITRNVIYGPATPANGSCSFGGEPGCYGIQLFEVSLAGSIANNKITGVGNGAGIYLGNGGSPMSVTSNEIFDIAGDGIQIDGGGPGWTVKDNIITQVQNGIDFGCIKGNTVSSNTISAVHSIGLVNVPSGTTSSNTYYNVPTISSSTCD